MEETEIKENWFICMITGITKTNKKSIDFQGNDENIVSKKERGKSPKKQSEVKRTIVLASEHPKDVLSLMNAGEDDNIVTAAEKAIRSKALSSSNLHSEKGLQKRFEFVCMLGPVTNKRLALCILASWERYRGSISRTIIAKNIAILCGVKFSIGWKSLLETETYNRKVAVVSSELTGDTTLYIYKPHSSTAIEKKDEKQTILQEEYQIRPMMKKETIH